MNTADKFESVRNLLGWSFEYLVIKLQKYTPEFLERVHRGEPMPEVENDLNRVYIEALAKRAVDSLLQGKSPERVRTGLTRRFIGFVRRKNLALDDVSRLSLRVSEGSFRELLTKDPDVVVVNWEGVLEEIIRDLKEPQQGKLIASSRETVVGSALVSPASDLPTNSQQPKRDPQAVLAECNTCHRPRPIDRYSEQTCGCMNDDYL